MKTATPLHRPSLLIGLLVAGMLTLTACDSNGGGSTDAVVGVYEFTQFQFRPTSSAFSTIDVRDTLQAAQIEFFSDGTYSFRYRFEGEESSRNLRGNFSRSGQNVRINGEENDASRYQSVLLPRSFTLRIADGDQVDQLTADFSETFSGATLRNYNPDEYEGVSSVSGNIRLALERTF